MIQEFNQTIAYIEDHLIDGALDPDRIAKLSGYSYAMFSRIFAIMLGYPLSEYIRQRRMTLAAIKLRDERPKIIDLALELNYESADAFAYAFKKFHGHTPSEIKKGQNFRIFSPVHLTLSIEGGNAMDVQIKKIGSFSIAGVKANDISSTQCPDVWKELFKKASPQTLSALGNGNCYGACFEISNENIINYMAAFDVADLDKARSLGLEIMEIPEAEYAIFRLKGAIPGSIHRGWEYVVKTFFPSHGYRHAGSPDFEFYYDGDMYDDDYEMELWVPIVKDK